MLRMVWIGMLIAGFALLMLAIILTFAFKIPTLVDELSGRKAKRQIKRLKELNHNTAAGMENMGTEEVYSAMSSGSLLSSEMSKLEKEGVSAGISNPKKEEYIGNDDIEVSDVEVSGSLEDEEEIPTTTLSQDEDDIETGFVNIFESDKEEGTTLMDEDATGLAEDSSHSIRIIEEQSSIL